MTEKTEGTIVLDGLIEGKAPEDADVRDKLRQWADFTRENGLPFTIDLAHSGFSVLPENVPVPVQPIGANPESVIVQAIEQLLGALPDECRTQVFSTLRSSEYRPGEEVQAVYAVNPDGTVQAHKRTVEAQTVAPPPPVTLGEKVRLAGIGLVLALALVGVSLLFPGVRQAFAQLFNTIRSIDVEQITFDAAAFADWFVIDKTEIGGDPRAFIITLKRTEQYPATPADLDAAAKAAGDSLSKRLAVEAIARGYLEAEVYNDDGAFIGKVSLRIRALNDNETATVRVVIPAKTRVGKVVLTY